MENIQTPIKINELVSMLNEAGYEQEKINFLKEGFSKGFDIGYKGPEKRQSTSHNLPFTVGNKVDMWNKLMKEVGLGRVAGPFDTIPYENYIQSPIGLVPKANNKTRLIFHLSYSFEKEDKLQSLNHHTSKDICAVKYRDLDYAVQAYLKLVGQDKIIDYEKRKNLRTKVVERRSLQERQMSKVHLDYFHF